MRNFLFALIVLFAAAFTTEKSYKVQFTEGQVNMLYNTLQASKVAVTRSDMPVNQATVVLANIDSLSKIIAVQYVAQNDTTKKK